MNNESSESGILESIWSSFWLWFFVLSLVVCAAVLPSGLFKPRRTHSGNSCVANLKQLDGAKEQWALENKKATNDIPTWKALIGTNAYIKITPKCPSGGVYQLNRVDQPPTCSLGTTVTPPHILPQ